MRTKCESSGFSVSHFLGIFSWLGFITHLVEYHCWPQCITWWQVNDALYGVMKMNLLRKARVEISILVQTFWAMLIDDSFIVLGLDSLLV